MQRLNNISAMKTLLIFIGKERSVELQQNLRITYKVRPSCFLNCLVILFVCFRGGLCILDQLVGKGLRFDLQIEHNNRLPIIRGGEGNN